MNRAVRSTTDSTVDTGLSLDRAAHTLSLLATVVERFVAEWDTSGYPPDMAAFLPDSPAVRRVTLIELIKVDLEYRWLKSNLPKRLIEYCEEFPELRAEPLPTDLIYEEFHIRRQSGIAVDPREYLDEFPDQAERLKQLLNIHDDYRSTLIAAPGAQGSLDDVDVGQQVDDFDLLVGLGRGAFARVFLARQRSMQRLVAVKVSHDHGTEPQTLAQLDHDYIVRVFDQRLMEDRKLRLLYMQYLPGGTLQAAVQRVRETPTDDRSGRLLLDTIDDVLQKKGELRPSDSSTRDEIARLTWPETIAWLGTRLAQALDYAARHGVLHRDIKPANVLLTSEGVPKLADFNISFSDNVAGATPAAYFGGSLAYMSPEQLEACHPQLPGSAEDLDARSDLFSLGVMLWELLTGYRPYNDEGIAGGWGTSLDGMLDRRRTLIDATILEELPRDCPAALRRVLLKCLTSKREDRWSSGAELSQQFDLCLDARARELVDPPLESWRLKLRRWTIPVLLLAILGPNGVAGAYNYYHNHTHIIEKLPPVVNERFQEIMLVINLVAYPLATAIIVYLCRYPLMVPRGLRQGRAYDAATLARTRADTLLLGVRVVAVCVLIWTVCGIAYPVALHIATGGLPWPHYAHFFASLLICGLIATAYPFFLVTFYAVRCLYPALLPYGGTTQEDVANLRRLDRRNGQFLMLAASVPLVTIAALTLLPEESNASDLVRLLCLGGIGGFALAYWLYSLLQEDLDALQRVVTATASSRA
jgi:serine/threonine protein kinase